MDERHAHSPRPDTRLRVDQLYAFRLQICQGRVQILDSKSDVMKTLAALGDKFAHWRVQSSRLHEFYSGLANIEHRRDYPLILDHLRFVNLGPEHIPVESRRSLYILHGVSEMLDFSQQELTSIRFKPDKLCHK